jgi:hypothetical protein
VPTFTPTPTAIPTIALAESLDNTELSWETHGFSHWFGQEVNCIYDGDAAQSGRIKENEYTRVHTEVMGPGTLSFWWKVSSQEGGDYLRLYEGAEEMANITGEVDWERRVFYLGAGTHPLDWYYETDEDKVISGWDCGWVDRVEFDPGLPWTPTPTLTPTATWTLRPPPTRTPTPVATETPTPTETPTTSETPTPHATDTRTPTETPTAVPESRVPDYNGDGVVNEEDLLECMRQGGPDGSVYDLDGDGEWTVKDQFLFSCWWGKVVPTPTPGTP